RNPGLAINRVVKENDPPKTNTKADLRGSPVFPADVEFVVHVFQKNRNLRVSIGASAHSAARVGLGASASGVLPDSDVISAGSARTPGRLGFPWINTRPCR